MELLQSAFLPLLLTFFLFLLLVATKRNKSKIQNSNSRLPPGPWKLPIIGSLHHLIGAPPHRVLRDLSKKYGPLMHLKLGEINLIVVSSPEAAREITKTHDLNFASRPEIMVTKILCYGSTGVAFSPYGNYWRQLRKICVMELLSPQRVRSFSSIREEEAMNHVREISMAAKLPVNLTEMFVSLANTTTCRAAFRMGCMHLQKFLSAFEELNKLGSGFNLTDLYPSSRFIIAVSTGVKLRLERVNQQLDTILHEIIREHEVKRTMTNSNGEESEEEDLVDVLLRIKDSGGLEIPLTMNTIKAVIMDMFTAGTETSSSIMEWAMTELMRNPEVMRKAQEEMRQVLKGKAKIEEGDIGELHYLKLIIKETLRLHPPVPLLLPRVSRETCVLDEFTIPVGSRVIINVWAMGRDPQSWDDAESFRPERFNGSSIDFKGGSFEYLPFGAGRRICPGMAFGLSIVELAMAQLLYHFNWQLPNGMTPEELDMAETFGLTVRRKNDLCLLATPYIPLPIV